MSYPMSPDGRNETTIELPVVSPDRVAAITTELVPLLYPGQDSADATATWNRQYRSALTAEPAGLPVAEQAPNLWDFVRNRRSERPSTPAPASQFAPLPQLGFNHSDNNSNQPAYSYPTIAPQEPVQRPPAHNQQHKYIGDIHRQRRRAGLFLGGTALTGAITGISEYAAATTETGQVIGFSAAVALVVKVVASYVHRNQQMNDEKEAELLAKALKQMSH